MMLFGFERPNGEKTQSEAHEFEKLPTGALGLCTPYEPAAYALRQLMAGCRKSALEHVGRDDWATLTREAAETSAIQYVRGDRMVWPLTWIVVADSLPGVIEGGSI